MNDRDFLIWLHNRLTDVHGENDLMDYMHKLRAIIEATPPGRLTPNVLSANSLDDLKQEIYPSPADVDAALKAAGYGGMAETKPSPYDRALDAVRHNAERTATHEIEIAAMDGRLHARTGDSPIKKHFVPKMSKQDQAEYIQAKIADAEQRFIRALVKLAE